MEIKLKWITLALCSISVSTKDINDLFIEDENTHLDTLNEESKVSENAALLKINFYAIFFINLYIAAFVVLIVYCTRCGENRNGK